MPANRTGETRSDTRPHKSGGTFGGGLRTWPQRSAVAPGCALVTLPAGGGKAKGKKLDARQGLGLNVN
jgi:hypothetical protein